ncbi:MAG: GNAT family N-acetyltransferase [Acutalibacteraceae bacterium]
MKTPTLKTERLILRPLLVSDAESVFLWTSDERVTKYMLYPKHEKIEATLEWLKSIDHDSEKAYDFGFVEKEIGLLIGSGGLYWEDDNEQWRIGYNLRFDRWGKGFATEAAKEIMRFAKEELRAEKIGSEHAVDNIASGKVLEKCGLHFTKYGEYTKFDGSVTFRCKEYVWKKEEG